MKDRLLRKAFMMVKDGQNRLSPEGRMSHTFPPSKGLVGLAIVLCVAALFSRCAVRPDMFATRSQRGDELFGRDESAVRGIANAYLSKRLGRAASFDAESVSEYVGATTWTELMHSIECGKSSVALRKLGRELEVSDGKATRTLVCSDERLLIGPMWCEGNGRVGVFVADYSMPSLFEQLAADDTIGYRIYPASFDPSRRTFHFYRKVGQEVD